MAWLMTGQLDLEHPRIIPVHTVNAMYQSVIGNIQDSITSYCNPNLMVISRVSGPRWRALLHKRSLFAWKTQRAIGQVRGKPHHKLRQIEKGR